MNITLNITPDDLYELSFSETKTNLSKKIIAEIKSLLPEKFGELEQMEILCDEITDHENDKSEKGLGVIKQNNLEE